MIKWVVAWISIELTGQNLSETIEKSVLANQTRPEQDSKVFKKVTNARVNSRPGETYPYVNPSNQCMN